MRWPWRRHGRRRRADPVVPAAADHWASSWGDTFLPQPPLRSAVEDPPSTTVRLGFSDGTELELAEGDEHFEHLVRVAGHLNNTDAGRFAG